MQSTSSADIRFAMARAAVRLAGRVHPLRADEWAADLRFLQLTGDPALTEALIHLRGAPRLRIHNVLTRARPAGVDAADHDCPRYAGSTPTLTVGADSRQSVATELFELGGHFVGETWHVTITCEDDETRVSDLWVMGPETIHWAMSAPRYRSEGVSCPPFVDVSVLSSHDLDALQLLVARGGEHFPGVRPGQALNVAFIGGEPV